MHPPNPRSRRMRLPLPCYTSVFLAVAVGLCFRVVAIGLLRDLNVVVSDHPPTNPPSAAATADTAVVARGSSGPDKNNKEKQVKPPSASATVVTLVSGGPDEKEGEKEIKDDALSTGAVDVGLNASYLSYLETLPALPKKVGIFFPEKDYWRKDDPPLPFVEYSILNLMKLNPQWNVTVYDDNEVDQIIADGSRIGIISKEECQILIGRRCRDVDDPRDVTASDAEWRPAAHIVERTDIARLILMYTIGGLFMDADRLVNKNLDVDVFRPATRLCLPTMNDGNFAQDVMCSSPGNELFLDMIKAASEYRMKSNKGKPLERRNGWSKGGSLFDMGPPIYNEAINRRVFGKDGREYVWEKDGGPSLTDVRATIEAIANGIIVTGKDGVDECKSGFLMRNMPEEQCRLDREELYKKYNMTSWGPSVNALWEDSASEDELEMTIDPAFLKRIEMLPPLPKRVHIFFPDKNYWRTKDPIPFVRYSILSLMKLNPTWEVSVYEDADIDTIIRSAVLDGLISEEECDILVGKRGDDETAVRPAAHIAERSNIARLLLMYTAGGMFLGAEMLMNRNLDTDVFRPATRLCLPTMNDGNFAQDIMCTSPRNELFLDMIKAASDYRMKSNKGNPLERRNGWAEGGALFDMGPPNYNLAINQRVFRKRHDELSDNKKALKYARTVVIPATKGLIVTGIEGDKTCQSSFLTKDVPPDQCVGREELYQYYNLTRWSTEVDALWEN